MNDHPTAAANPAAAVSTTALMAHVAEFARRIKLSGTPDERASLEYVRGQLDGFGYATTIILHDAYISLPGKAAVRIDNRDVEAITHAFSQPSPPGGLSGRLVDIGDGAAIAGQALAGCVLLVDGIASPAVAALASRAGAAGVIQVSPHQHLHEMCISPVWGSPTSDTIDAMPSVVVTTISLADGTALRERLRAGEAPHVLQFAEVDTGWRKTPILVAEMAPPDAAADAPFVLFSGHHDTWYYGVMDNGTANATMIEVARLMAEGRCEWQRGLRLCFWSGHSHGRYSGSCWYADEYWDELDRRCLAHVNIDSTGGIGASVMTESGVASELGPLARDVIEAETGLVHEGRRGSRSSDMSFWGIGIPSMFGSLSHQAPEPVTMRNALGWWWHTPHDLIDKIDPDFLARDTRIFARTLWRLLTEPVVPIDATAHADALLSELDQLQAALANRHDLTSLIDAAKSLRHGTASLADQSNPATINEAIRRVARALVPIDYTTGDRFRHDPALPQPPWPALQPLRNLAKTPKDSEAAHLATPAATRARNRVLHAIREACAAVGMS
jgi:hypothetical protein